MGLKEPKLKSEEYEIRIWYNMSFQYGEAQMAYLLRKTQQEFTVAKYLIKSNKRGFQKATLLQPTLPVSPDSWSRLLAKNILVLPDRSVVFERLYRRPAPISDTDRVRQETDGSFTIRGQKNKNQIAILDGEAFYFEVFSVNNYHAFVYDNPRRYSSFYSECEELRNVVDILDELTSLFEPKEGKQHETK
ncbi:hypothetical protein GCM10028817_29960 [Spirosoma pomorum]